MAPIKFEEQLKDKLEQRRIQPSSDAWKQLNNKLDANESKHNNKGFWMLGIAATIVGILLALTFVFKSNTKIVEPTIVDTNNDNIIEKQDLQNLEENNAVAIEQNGEPSDNIQQGTTQKQPIKAPLKSVIKEQQEALISNKHNEAVADVTIKSMQEETDKKAIDAQLGIVSFEDQKVNDVVAQNSETSARK
jgi:hypothetical protein